MTKQRMEQVKDHFNSEATVFDKGILKSVPYYTQMLEVLTNMLPFKRSAKIDVLDVGSGTGNIALAVKLVFPNAKILCLDLAPNMLNVAKEKLSAYKEIEYVQADVADYKFNRKFDAIVSSLTLHHLETDSDKHKFHLKAFKALKSPGMFVNADIIVAPEKEMQSKNIEKWKQFILKSSSEEFVKDRYKKYLAEDRPAVLLNEVNSLKKSGFKHVEVFWKYYNFAVYGGMK